MQVIRHSNSANTFFAHNSIIDYSTTRIDESLVGVSKWTEDARMLVSLHSTHDDTVIIVGERGTGKKLIARLIHRNSARRRGPFVSLSLGSITEDVARSSLFGSNENETKDSFTSDKGLLEQAQGGTLYISGISAISRDFIDEILRRSLNNRERGMQRERRRVHSLHRTPLPLHRDPVGGDAAAARNRRRTLASASPAARAAASCVQPCSCSTAARSRRNSCW